MTARIASLLLCALLALFPLAPAQAGPSLVFEPETGRVISADRAGDAWYPASLTKLMTAYLTFSAIREGKLTLDARVPVSKAAASAVPSKIGFQVGTPISIDLALQAMLVYSANDMAVLLAEGVAGDVPAFVARMNETARKLGMNATHFVNPNGLFDPAQVSSARDIALLAGALYREFPEHRHYYSQGYVTIGKAKLKNRNMLLRQMPNAEGMKTGFVCKSGFNLVALAHGDAGRRVMAVLFGAESAVVRANWAQGLLTGSLGKAAGQATVADIANSRNAPADMSGEVCRGRAAKLVPARALKGFGASLGTFPSRSDAARLIDAHGALIAGDEDAHFGIVRLPKASGYGVFLWNATLEEAEAHCAALKAAGAACQIQQPEDFAKLAAAAPGPAKKPAPVKPQAAPAPVKNPVHP